MVGLTLNTRSRVKPNANNTYVTAIDEVEWETDKAAVIICDMWDSHYCISAAKRVREMATRVNEVIAEVRKKGALVIHSPCDCMDFYADTPQRSRAMEAPHVDAPVKIKWNEWDPAHEAPFPSVPGRCACPPTEPGCTSARSGFRQIETIGIAEDDAISDHGQEVYNLLQQHNIENIIIMGVHTDVCVLSQPYGIRQLVYLGKKPLLCRDLTDSFRIDHMDHFQGTDLIIEHIERHWCPTITSDQIAEGQPFRFHDDKREQH